MFSPGLPADFHAGARASSGYAQNGARKSDDGFQEQRCLAGAWPLYCRCKLRLAAAVEPRDDGEAVFSSSEDRIRANHGSIGVLGHSIVSQASQGWTRRVAESLFCVFFPSDCRICGEPLLNISRLPVCPPCLNSIYPIRGKVCSVCGERVFSSYAEVENGALRRCPICRRVRRPFERAVAYGQYEGGLRELIHLLKYNGVRPAAKVLGGLLAEAMAALEPEAEQMTFEQKKILVIPVPLSKAKRRQRGFNQSELIAQAALRFRPASEGWELAPDILLRTRDTESQIGLSSHQRRANLLGAFALGRATAVTGRMVLLVDDVYTTGATAAECAKVLQRAGASTVWVATVARTLKLASNYESLESGNEEAVARHSDEVSANAAQG